MPGDGGDPCGSLRSGTESRDDGDGRAEEALADLGGADRHDRRFGGALPDVRRADVAAAVLAKVDAAQEASRQVGDGDASYQIASNDGADGAHTVSRAQRPLGIIRSGELRCVRDQGDDLVLRQPPYVEREVVVGWVVDLDPEKLLVEADAAFFLAVHDLLGCVA